MRSGAAAAASVFRNPQLRRVVGAYALFIASEYGAWISILVWAYDEGGSRTAGAIAIAQLLPAAVAAPLVASIADRRPPAALLIGGYLLQACALGATAAAAAWHQPVLVWLFAVVASTAVVTTRPAQATLLPGLARRVQELAAANATLAWVESSGVVLAGVTTGVIVGSFGTSAGIAAAGILAAAAALLALPARGGQRMAAAGDGPTFRDELTAGLGAVRESTATRLLLSLQTATWVVVGALDILFVVLAVRILRDGAGWVGYLNAAYGFGGLAAGLTVAATPAVRRMTFPILGGAALLSIALGAVSISPTTAGAVVMLACVGAGRVLLDVSTRTLLQRIVPADVIGRVFGVVEGLSMAGLAVGSLLAPLLVGLAGPRGAFVGVALLLPLVAVVVGRRILLLDRTAHVPVVEIALLRSNPLFRWLPGPNLETAARALEPLDIPAGTVLIEEGDPVADRFYAIAAGEVDVVRGGKHVARLGRGEGVGEMALLRPIPRTATVTAASDVLAYALDRESFLVAVTGHASTTSAADDVVDTRFAQLRELGLLAED